MMASFSLSTSTPTTLFSKLITSKQPSILSPHRFKVSCKADAADDDHLILPKISSLDTNRRNVLLGLGGGLYGAANFPLSAFADPITTPDDINDCAPPDDIDHPDKALRPLNCCPPTSEDKHPKRYILPDVSDDEVRVRRPAHKATEKYINDYRDAVKRMRQLPDSDPRSWKNQAKIHCAYCNDIYNQAMTGHPGLKIQVHSSSLFFPFHRWYLYFYERILGSLIDDPTFALPYWNWDSPGGMMIPGMYGDGNSETNPLFDDYRQPEHINPAIVDLNYNLKDHKQYGDVNANLNTMKKSVKYIYDTDSFFGTDPSRNCASIPGSVEHWPHNATHLWTGNQHTPNWEDMGNFYSAAYDPIFFAHHSNVDRMWTLWKDLSPNNRDPISSDWLNASFVFYDENKQLVRVFNEDCVDTRRMGYKFETSETPWETVASTPPRVKRDTFGAEPNPFEIGQKKVEDTAFPLKLNQKVKVLVKRPATNRTKDDKEKAKEMLFVNGIKFDGGKFVKFDILVNDPDDGIESTPSASEFAGTFIHVPHNHGREMTTGRVFGITEVLEDLKAEGDEYVLVTLVPWAGTDDATVSEIKIELLPIN